ncbi:MAG: carboxy terminal-processing peptidase [Oleiphilaceae bacterium]|nr:carboxy terminal-processing peptidase [Oleiphilaceae bacterium]
MPAEQNAPMFPIFRVALTGLLCLMLISPLAVLAETESERAVYRAVEPTPDQARATLMIGRQLQHTHFRDQKVDEELAGRVLDAYIDSLDDQRLYLLQSDVDHFNTVRGAMDRALRNARLGPAFRIYNHVQARTIERLEYALEVLDEDYNELDFDTDEEYRIDRSDADWAGSREELDRLWRQRIKNAILDMRLDGQSDEDIRESLTKRYQSRLNRTLQSRSEDAFQAWMNAYTTLWDPHTQYLSPRVSENFDINMSLSLEGIGAVLQSDNEYTKVSRVVPGGPASKQGQLQSNDRIVGVAQGEDGDMENVIGMRLDEVVDRIRGPKESKVRLEVIPAGAASEVNTREIVIVRDEVKLEEQAAQKHMLELEREDSPYNVGVIQLPTFYADMKAAQAGDSDYKSTTRDVRNLIEEMKSDGMEALVIDLRNNGGGALMEANSLVGLFVESGPTVQVRAPDGRVQVYQDQDNSVAWDGPIVVLVNRLSASASEIFAGAMQDYGRALIMGSQTFGKGTVQGIRSLNHGQLKITQSKFYRITGDSMQHRGVVPDIKIPGRIGKDEVGEDSLDNALGWDQIDPVEHTVYYDFDQLLEKVRPMHKKRFQSHPEYELMMREIELLEEQRNRSQVSLNADKRRAEKEAFQSQRLSLANQRRELNGKEPFEDWQAYEEDAENRLMQRASRQEQEPDFIVEESGHILADILALHEDFASIHNNDANQRAAMSTE